jgi:hypothetical protein
VSRPDYQSHLYRTGGSAEDRVADMLEWAFHIPDYAFMHRVNSRDVYHALNDVVTASFATVGNPLEVKLAWQVFMDTVGSGIFSAFIRMGAWEDFTPPVPEYLHTHSKHVLWVGHDKRVVLTLVYVQDEARDIRLWVEDIT